MKHYPLLLALLFTVGCSKESEPDRPWRTEDVRSRLITDMQVALEDWRLDSTGALGYRYNLLLYGVYDLYDMKNKTGTELLEMLGRPNHVRYMARDSTTLQDDTRTLEYRITPNQTFSVTASLANDRILTIGLVTKE